jgi:acyl carrier protein
MQVTREDIVAVIRQVKVVDAPENLRTDVKLTDQGIDSLGMFSVILGLQEKHEIEIPDADIDMLNTIDELMSYIENRCL